MANEAFIDAIRNVMAARPKTVDEGLFLLANESAFGGGGNSTVGNGPPGAGTGSEGQFYFDQTSGILWFHDGISWNASSGTSIDLAAREAAIAAQAAAQAADANADSAAALAAAAAAAASGAQSDADSALTQLQDISSDSVLTPGEKPDLIREMAENDAEYPDIQAAGTTFGNTAQRTTYVNAYNALKAYLTTLTSPVAWNNTSSNTTIVAATFRQKFVDYYTARQALLNANADVARATAQTAQNTAAQAAAAAAAADAAAGSASAAASAAQTAAENAASAAATAQSDATDALSQLTAIASDSIITPGEKPDLIREVEQIVQEYDGIQAAGTTFGNTAQRTLYVNAKGALDTYLATLTSPVAWNNTSGNTTIVAATFQQKFNDYYFYRQDLLNDNADVARSTAVSASTAAANAATAAGNAQTAATNAANAASTAQADATNALGQLTNIASDSVITPGEKPDLIREWAQIDGEYTGIYNAGTAFGTTTERGDYSNQKTSLANYLGALGPYAWNDTAGNTTIVAATFRQQFQNYYNSRQTLLNAISAKAKALADGAQNTAVGRSAYLNYDPLMLNPSAWGWEQSVGSFVDVSDAPVGRTVVRSYNGSMSFLHENYFIPIDRTKKYRVRFYARKSSTANGVLYMCLRQWKDQGSNYCNTDFNSNGGRSPYKPSGDGISTAWQEFSYEWGGSDWQSDMKYVQVDFLMNHNATAGYMEVCNVRVDEMVSVGLCVSEVFQTSNYEVGGYDADGEWASKGAKMLQSVSGRAPALLVDPYGMRVGQVTFDVTYLRLFQALAGDMTKGVFYRGNNDTSSSYRYGAPDINCLTVTGYGWYVATPGVTLAEYLFKLQPASITSNLDGMRYVQVDFYDTKEHAWAGGGTGLIAQRSFAAMDRLYNDRNNHASASNASAFAGTIQFAGNKTVANPGALNVAMRCSLYNVYGASATVVFEPAGVNVVYPKYEPSGAGVPAVPSAGTGNSSDDADKCPAPWVKLLLADGSLVRADEIRVGDIVWTQPESGGTYGAHEVSAVSMGVNALWRLRTEDGRSLEFAPNHRFLVQEKGWVELQCLVPGDVIDGTRPGVVVETEKMSDQHPVVQITVAGAHTYITDGLLSHNMKAL